MPVADDQLWLQARFADPLGFRVFAGGPLSFQRQPAIFCVYGQVLGRLDSRRSPDEELVVQRGMVLHLLAVVFLGGGKPGRIFFRIELHGIFTHALCG